MPLRHKGRNLVPVPPSLRASTRRPSAADMNAEYEVRVRLNVLRLITVDLQQQTFTANIFMEASWLEPKLSATDEPVDDADDDVYREQSKGVLKVKGKDESFFAPRLTIRNCVDVLHAESWFRIRKCSSTGKAMVCYRSKLTGIFQEQMELKKFPLDSQNLTIELITNWQKSKCHLMQNQSKKYASNVVTSTFIHAKEYDLYQHLKFTEAFTRDDESAEQHVYSMLLVALRVDRNSWYWSLNVLLPLFIITTCTLASWSVPANELADRCSITLTMLLAMVGFKYIVGEKLPNISYATYVDQYTIFCFVFTFAEVIAQTVLAARNTAGGNDIPSPLHAIAISSCWLGFHVIGGALLSYRRRTRIQEARFWSMPRTAVWVCGFDDDFVRTHKSAFEASDDTDAAQTAKDEIIDLLSKDQKHRRVTRVRLWDAKRAQAALAAGSDTPLGRSLAQSVRNVLDHLDPHDHHDEDEPRAYFEKRYRGTRPFAVVTFKSARAANEAVRKMEPPTRAGLSANGLQLELLQGEWYELAEPLRRDARSQMSNLAYIGKQRQERLIPPRGAAGSELQLTKDSTVVADQL